MTASNLQSEPCSAIYPYALLSTYRLLLCQVCAIASVADEVATHLRTRHRDIQPERRQELAVKIKQIPNILHSRDDLRHYLQYPTDTIQPIPYLAPPKPDGLKCRACGHIVRRVEKIQKHCAEKHQWMNPRGRGRPAPNCHVSAYELPWEEHVACQRFFPSREGSKWFQVNIRIKEQANRPGAKPSAKKPQGTLQALTSEASIHLQQVIERDTQYREALSQQPRATVDDAGTNTFPATSLWLDRTQWPSIYRGSRRDVLRALTRSPDRHSLDDDYILGQGILDSAQDLISPRKDEQKVSFIMKALGSVINRCEDTVCATSRNFLCWLLSSRLQSRREFGFKLVVERSSEIRYRRTQKQFLAFVLRIYRMPDDSLREMVNVKMKPGIITQLDRIWEHSIWNYFDLAKGTWPVIERQRSPLAGTCSSLIGGQCISSSLNNRPCQGSDAENGTEDSETDDENVEAWELDDDEDDEDGESDYDDSGHYNDFDDFVLRSAPKVISMGNQALHCSYISAASLDFPQTVRDSNSLDSTAQNWSIGIPQRPDAGQFECFNQIRAKYMVLGSQYPLAELISLRDFGRNIARTEPPSMLFHWSNDSETVSHATFK
ncbi:uncharacterized protein BKA55DRAFT_540773 [Fusarium redolens]|uniref:C2H2-type domain-containing protein n=1 Tax=Fusarium redolens TaxID=48865 RepID=A0A9P9GZJ4_FUSRE|nr:uncharacterized protein BKA55DRAFT_540773 [Fusarium redolens]KAH7247494.1 hypothetical protein BKA55DRAFT_540773 [Fusarium redolens]